MSWRGTAEEENIYAAALIVAAQARCSNEEGLTLLTRRADELTRTVPDAAQLVVAGILRFD